MSELTKEQKEAVVREAIIKAGLYDEIDQWGKDHLKHEYLELCVQCALLNAELEILKPKRIILAN